MTTLDQSQERLTRIENLPNSLQKFDCGYNRITRIENLPQTLQEFHCYNNEITRIENLPNSLHKFDCSDNQITRIENLPDSLQQFYYYRNPIEYVDNLLFIDFYFVFSNFRVKEYTKIKKCTRTINNWYNKCKSAALVITRNCHNWILKPLCNDGTIGIRPRLDTRYLGL
jgi:hypothetical protein